MSRRRANGGEAVTGAQLRETERGFTALLRAKGFPATWIDRHSLDLVAQAASEYAAWMKKHEPEENPVGWLITCAYRRALNLLTSQRRRPPAASVEDAALALADDSLPTPEEAVLDDERQRRLRKAMECLVPKERRLITLVYFEGHSVRDAGRRLGWGKSAADRHHRSALERLRAVVGEDRNLLSPASLGLAVWALEGRGGGFARRIGEGLRPLVPLAEPGSLAVSSGGGRALGLCGAGVAAALCGLVVTGAHPALPGSHERSPARPPHREFPAISSEPRRNFAPAAPEPAPSETRSRAGETGAKKKGRAAPAPPSKATRLVARPKPASNSAPAPEPVVEEFGIEGSSQEASVEEQASAPAPSAPAENNTRTSPPTPSEASSAQVNKEFGL
jgi:RNA polymerase sigma factor (sigma-70 family)